MYCGHKIILTSAWLSYRLTVLTCSWGVMPAREKCFNKYWLVSATATTDRPYIQQIIVSFLLFDQRWTFWSVPCFAKNSQMWSVLQWQPSLCQISLHYFYKSWLQQWWQGVDGRGSNGGKKLMLMVICEVKGVAHQQSKIPQSASNLCPSWWRCLWVWGFDEDEDQSEGCLFQSWAEEWKLSCMERDEGRRGRVSANSRIRGRGKLETWTECSSQIGLNRTQ